jgi:2-dehydropantoate 2-reductase
MKITIAGIGGVGGYYGGMLAKHYANSKDVEVYFIARGENEKAIQQNGLKLETKNGNFTIHPKLVTSNPALIGITDLLICCTKGYDLEQSIEQLKPCINNETVLLPLLNGVNSAERIKAILPNNEVWDGCVYLVSQLAEPGLVKETGNPPRFVFGAKQGTATKLKAVEKIFTDAGITTALSDNILQAMWEKYLFLSPSATITSYTNKTMNEIAASDEYKKLLRQLISEIKPVAEKVGVVVPADAFEKTVGVMAKLPAGATTSMHRDFQKGKATELESLTGYVIKLGKQFGLAMPTYEVMYEGLKGKI